MAYHLIRVQQHADGYHVIQSDRRVAALLVWIYPTYAAAHAAGLARAAKLHCPIESEE